ncbi:hypothetical protein GCM10020331_093530 [Ectobacillus funiculus]
MNSFNKNSSEQVEHLLHHYGDFAITQFVDAVGHNPDQLNKLKELIQNLEKDEKNNVSIISNFKGIRFMVDRCNYPHYRIFALFYIITQ